MTTFVLGGGCFWCLDAVYQMTKGVESVVSGYTGGALPNPSYEQICSGMTGHAEVVSVTFDESVIPADVILDMFFVQHDPTTLNRQGNDMGPSYRSGIYFLTPEQEAVARETIADVDASGLWPGKVVTEVRPAGEFWEAEPEHQDYLERIPNGYTCHRIRPGWRLPKRGAA